MEALQAYLDEGSSPHPRPLSHGARGAALTPIPSPMGRGEMNSLSLRERARVRDKGESARSPWQGGGRHF